MNDVRIRPGTLDDLETVVSHRLGMFRDMDVAAAQLAAMEKPARAYFRQAIPGGRYHAFLAELNGCVIAGGGIVILHWPASPIEPRDSRAMILNVYTEPEFRRQGIARQLMQALVAWCRTEGYRTVSLHASVHGRTLYESLGFKQTNELRLNL